MKFKSLLMATATAVASIHGANAAISMIAGFDFQTTATGGTATAVAPGAPLVYNANFGTATLYLNGTNGSSTFTSTTPNPQITSFGGSNVNTVGTSFSTVTSGTSSLAIANTSSNNLRSVFKFSTVGFEDLVLTYSTQGTATGFNSQAWSYSTDGVTFTPFTTKVPASSFALSGIVTVDFSAIAAIENTANVYIGLTLSGATNVSGNNRFDNIQFNANAVPEPQAAALLGAVGVLGLIRRRRF